MTSVMIKLHQNHQKSKKDEMRKLNALEKMLNQSENKYKLKKG